MSSLAGPVLAIVFAVLAGVSFIMQQAVNADLRAAIGSAAWAGFVSYLGGTLCMLLLAVALRDRVPAASSLANSHWWAWTGGFFGAVYIAVSILLLPRIGAANFLALLIAGQMLGSLLFDHFGLFGLPPHGITLARVLGAVLLVAAVVLIRS